MTSDRLLAPLAAVVAICAGLLLPLALPSTWSFAVAVCAVLAIVAATYLAIRWPESMFALFLLAGVVKPAVSGVDLTLVAATLTTAGTILVVARRGLRRTPRAVWLFLGLAALLLVGVVGTPSPAYGLDKALRFSTLGLFTVLIAPQILIDRTSLRRFALTIGTFGAVVSIVAIAGGGDPAAYGRFTAFGGSTLALGEVTVVAFGAWAALGVSGEFDWLAALAGCVVTGWALFGSGDRAALLGLVLMAATLSVALVGSWLWRRRHRPDAAERTERWRPTARTWLEIAGVAVVIVLLVVAASAVWARTPEPARERYLRMVGVGERKHDNSLYERQMMYSVAWSLFQRSPLLGVGTGGFAAHSPAHWYPHNPVLELLAENGVVAGLIYISLAALAFLRAAAGIIRGPTFRAVLALACLSCLLPIVMLSNDINGYRIFYALIVVALMLPTLFGAGRVTGTPAQAGSAENSGT